MPVPPFPLARSRANTISYNRLSFSGLPQLLLPPSKPSSTSKSLWRVLALQLSLNFKVRVSFDPLILHISRQIPDVLIKIFCAVCSWVIDQDMDFNRAMLEKISTGHGSDALV
ncbi:hypothetical protein IEQ34_015791 [Dendrobium chrysotoxum]|uniref:Uncharacterized protein n=1 Tax=Dendrobium chrysotoxum TaxID=161865 RepID=A0AAV7G1R6_DENCH|nr:hypothetical protein IEQ34_015791 [Dendrobium chrysotoxum]